jgi:hypothetical protein
MRFVFEIPDQLVPALPSSDSPATGSASDAISGGAAPASVPEGALALAVSSAGAAEYPGRGVAMANGLNTAIDGGAAGDGG